MKDSGTQLAPNRWAPDMSAWQARKDEQAARDFRAWQKGALALSPEAIAHGEKVFSGLGEMGLNAYNLPAVEEPLHHHLDIERALRGKQVMIDPGSTEPLAKIAERFGINVAVQEFAMATAGVGQITV